MTTKAMRRGKLSKGVTFDLGCTGLEDIENDYTKSPPPVQWSTHPGLPRSLSLSSPVEYDENDTHDIILKLQSITFKNSLKSPSIIEEDENENFNHPGTPHILINEQNGCGSDDTLGSTSSDSLSQTLPRLSNHQSYDAKPSSISGKLEQLTNDLRSLQEQDISLLKQLMQIHFSMRMLKRGAYRRTNSVCVSRYRPLQFEPEPPTPTPTKRRPHPLLSRVQSEPGRYGFMCSSSFSSMEDDDIDEIEEDYLANSFNGVDLDNESSHYNSFLKLSLDLNDGTSDLLEDMPLPLRRKYLNSLTDNTTVPSKWPDRFRNQKSLEQRRQSLSRQDALQNLDLSRSSSVESEGGIELPAITVQEKEYL